MLLSDFCVNSSSAEKVKRPSGSGRPSWEERVIRKWAVFCSRVILEKRAASGDIHPEAQIFTVKKVTAFVQPITLQILHSQIELGGVALQPGGDHLHADAIGDTALLDRLELLGQCGRKRVENGINRFCACRRRSADAQTETDCQCGQRPAQDLLRGAPRLWLSAVLSWFRAFVCSARQNGAHRDPSWHKLLPVDRFQFNAPLLQAHLHSGGVRPIIGAISLTE